jgi:L-2-hydroxyglutarate oxidase
MVEFCQLHGIRHEACGKIIVATTASELPRLENLYERGIANGLEVRRLRREDVRELEPHVSCLAGIHVPLTGIVDYVGGVPKIRRIVRGRRRSGISEHDS